MMLRVCSILALFILSCFGEEPQCMCSKYHYEEQLLERMIRTEIKCEELQKKMAAMQEETATQINAVTEAMGQFTDRSNGNREETMAIINQEKVAINESLAKINALAGELHLT